MRDPENPQTSSENQKCNIELGWKAKKIFDYLAFKQSVGIISNLKRVEQLITLSDAGHTATYRPIFQYDCPHTLQRTLCILRGGSGGSRKAMALKKRIWMIEGTCRLEVYGIGMGGRKDAYLYDVITPCPEIKIFKNGIMLAEP